MLKGKEAVDDDDDIENLIRKEVSFLKGDNKGICILKYLDSFLVITIININIIAEKIRKFIIQL